MIFRKDTSAKKILLVGNVSFETMSEIQECLQKHMNREIIAAGNIMKKPQALTTLDEDSIVIDVETWSNSLHKDIRKAFRLIQASGKVIAGFIVTR